MKFNAQFASVVAMATCVVATSAEAQCHPGVIGGTQQAGPGHVSQQILRYDVGGPGASTPVLVSLGDSRLGGQRGVCLFDTSANQWRTLGPQSLLLDAGVAGVAFGPHAGDQGPNLLVVGATRQGYSTSGQFRDVALFDGMRWRAISSLPAEQIQSLTTFDADGDGPLARTPVALMQATNGTTRSLRAYVLVANQWTRIGTDLVMGNETGYPIVPSIVSWDIDGPQGPERESLYVVYRGFDEAGNSSPRLAHWSGLEWVSQPVTAQTIVRMRVMDLDGAGPDPARLALIGSVGPEYGVNHSPFMYFDGTAWTITPFTTNAIIGQGLDATLRSDGSLVVASDYGERVRLFRLSAQGWTSLLGGLATRTDLTSPADTDLIAVPSTESPTSDRVYISPVSSQWIETPSVGEVVIPSDPHATEFFAPTPGLGFDGLVRDAIRLPNGDVVVSGDFSSVDGLVTPRVARRDSQGRWHPLGNYAWSGLPQSLTYLDDGRILAIDLGSTSFYGPIMQFDGERWTRFAPAGNGIGAQRIYRSANGVLTFVRLVVGDPWWRSENCGIAQWRDGSFWPVDCAAQWNQVEIAVLANGDVVRAITPNADRPETATGLMRWDGIEWSPMGEGNNYATNLRVAGDGTLFGKRVNNRISRWNGTTWVDDPVNGPLRVSAISSFDVVGEDVIVAFGTFATLNGTYAPRHTIYSNVAFVRGTYWEDPFQTSFLQANFVAKAVGLDDGTTIVAGTIPSSSDRFVFDFYGMYQLSACNTCSPCTADWDESGGIDVADVAAFFADYEQGNRCADVDDSTGVDPVDMAIFFQAYEAGGC